MRKIIALFSTLMVFTVTSAFAACPIKVQHTGCCPNVQKISMAQPCCEKIITQPRCGCDVIKRNPCTGKIEKRFMGRTLDGTRSVYSNTLGNWYDASFGALFNAYLD